MLPRSLNVLLVAVPVGWLAPRVTTIPAIVIATSISLEIKVIVCVVALTTLPTKRSENCVFNCVAINQRVVTSSTEKTTGVIATQFTVIVTELLATNDAENVIRFPNHQKWLF